MSCLASRFPLSAWRLRGITLLAACLSLANVLPAQAQGTPPTQAAQQIPGLPANLTPQQAAQLLQQRPDLGRIVQQRLQASGMTPDQIRAQLRAAGYPANMLDAYLSADTTALPAPSQAMLAAISRLSLAQFTRSDSLLLSGDTLALQLYRDSLRADSIAREDSLARVRKGLPLFGLNVFRQASTSFQAVVSGPVDDQYVLGPGDVLVLLLTGAVEDAETLDVTRAGFVVVPRVGQIYVNGMTLGQLRDVLYDRLGRVYSGVTRSPDAKTKFLITVANVRMLTIRVAGEVGRPGSYQIPATGSVLTALYAAGGLTERAGFRDIAVHRGSELIGTVDLYDYLTKGITPTGIHLASGDVVYVPVEGARVKVTGEVKRPAIYEVKRGETLRDLIRIAGGLTPQASRSAITIDRILPADQRRDPSQVHTVLSVSLARDSTVAIEAGDSVVVYPFVAGRRNAVAIRGAVAAPGMYQLDPGMRLSDLIALAGGLRPDTYTGRAQIVRTLADSTRHMIGVTLAAPGDSGGDNPVLQEQDEVTVFAKPDFRPDRYVAVWGPVRHPGYIAYADSMTLKDAILLAGGLKESASLDSAQVSRFIGGNGGDSLQTVFTTPLDASYRIGPEGYPPEDPGTGQAPTVLLQPYDQVTVRTRPGWEAPGNVVISGEVDFPGLYAVLSKTERLSDLIREAGGLTPAAYADGIRFFRMGGGRRVEPAPPKTGAITDTTAPKGWPSGTTTQTLARFENSTWGAPARIGVDLARVLHDPSFHDNLILQPGDSIYIPQFVPFVRVEGSVNAPGTNVPYRAGAGINYYVDGAGGYAQLANKGGTFVQQANGIVQKHGDPSAGAVVVVPQRQVAQGGTSFFQILTAVLTPIISAATTIAVVIATRP